MLTWGESSWGEAIWGTAAAVPSLEGAALAALLSLLVLSGFLTVGARRRGRRAPLVAVGRCDAESDTVAHRDISKEERS